jgi:Na+/H+ antiporter NhaD/arsenite permease-like protein
MFIDFHNLPYLITVAIFLITYAGIAIGGIPGMALDRTGIALLGAIAMIVANNFSPEHALHLIDTPTIILLFSLMVIAGQLKVAGFYEWMIVKLYPLMQRPKLFLGVVIAVSALLSALLVNDVICLAFTPILTIGLKRAGLNPVPYLLALAAASNIGSAATIIGNPQNMLIGQVGRLDFLEFLLWCLPATVLSLFLIYFVIHQKYRRWLKVPDELDLKEEANELRDFNWHQSAKGLIFLFVLILLFFTKIPRELSALVLAGCVLCSRSVQTRKLLGNVDWHLICLFCGLFIRMMR